MALLFRGGDRPDISSCLFLQGLEDTADTGPGHGQGHHADCHGGRTGEEGFAALMSAQ